MARISKEKFGEWEGRDIYLFTLENTVGNRVSVIDYGATITSWIITDAGGNARDIVTGFKTLQEYIDNTAYFGCVAGRYANRIANGSFSIDGTTHYVTQNNGKNHLHGGNKGFDKIVWDASIKETDTLSLKYLSPDAEEGFPGNLSVEIQFSYTDDDELVIGYFAETDKPTVLNLTSHSYFNLSGDMTTTILDHILQINADSYTAVDEALIPTGELKPVTGTALDFRQPKVVGDNMEAAGGEYDHNFVLNKLGTGLSFAALLQDPISKMQMTVFTTEPGLQLYTGNMLDGNIKNRDGKSIQKHGALCLETQHFPDSPNHAHFPSTTLMPGENFFSKTVYKVTAG